MTQPQPPPSARKFRPAVDVRHAKFLDCQPAFIKRKRSRGKFAVGIRYERQVHDHLALLALGMPSIEYREGQWVEFTDANGRRYCQLDALMVDRANRLVVIYEIKYQHCAEAWWQLTHLYEPVIRCIYPSYTVGRMEIVHWHDPAVAFPERYDLTESPLRVPKANSIAVCIFNPKRRGDHGRVLSAGSCSGPSSREEISGATVA